MHIHVHVKYIIKLIISDIYSFYLVSDFIFSIILFVAAPVTFLSDPPS